MSTETFVYPGLPEGEIERLAKVQLAEVQPPWQLLPERYDPDHVLKIKESQRKAFIEKRTAEIYASLEEIDACKVVHKVEMRKGEPVEVSTDSPSIEKFRGLKKLGILTGRAPGRPKKEKADSPEPKAAEPKKGKKLFAKE
jgi:hypothetical protein